MFTVTTTWGSARPDEFLSQYDIVIELFLLFEARYCRFLRYLLQYLATTNAWDFVSHGSVAP